MKPEHFTNSCLRVSLQFVVWIYSTFDNNFGTENDLTKYLKERCS